MQTNMVGSGPLASLPPWQRASERFEVDVVATLQIASHFVAGQVKDLSEGGVCVLGTSFALEVGEALALAFPLDGELVMARGTVRWVRGSKTGIEFSHIAPFDRQMIAAFCKKLAAK